MMFSAIFNGIKADTEKKAAKWKKQQKKMKKKKHTKPTIERQLPKQLLRYIWNPVNEMSTCYLKQMQKTRKKTHQATMIHCSKMY